MAWTDPARFARWFGPKGWTVERCEVDARPGGSWRAWFKTGKGVTQAEYPAGFFESAERNSRTRYVHKLLRKWIPAMPQVVEILKAGGLGADVGCGGGRAAIMIANSLRRGGNELLKRT